MIGRKEPVGSSGVERPEGGCIPVQSSQSKKWLLSAVTPTNWVVTSEVIIFCVCSFGFQRNQKFENKTGKMED